MSNVYKLKALFESNPAAKAIFKDLGQRERHRDGKQIARWLYELQQAGYKGNEDDFDAVIEELKAAGFAEIIKDGSLKGRIEWKQNLKELAERITGSPNPKGHYEAPRTLQMKEKVEKVSIAPKPPVLSVQPVMLIKPDGTIEFYDRDMAREYYARIQKRGA